MSFNGFLTFVFFMMSVEYKGQVHGCNGNVTKTFARIGGVASFKFSFGKVNSDQTFTFLHPSNEAIALMVYSRVNNSTVIQTLPNVTLQVNSNWEIQINKSGIVTDDKGLYNMGTTLGVSFCSFLYIFGKPQKPVLSHDNKNILGGNSRLSCNSISTTYPSNHTLGFNYSWEVNGIRNPQNPRYKYGSSRKTLTILSVIKDDANKRFKCIATESGDGVIGLTSDNSDEFVFRVIYGPDANTTTLSPSTTEYSLNESARLNDITCFGDCYPRCSFRWTKSGTNGASEVSNNAVLSLGTLSRAEAATYTCEVTNANTTVTTVRKQVVVNVNYGPDASTTKLIPSSVTYTHNEGYSFNDIQCSGNCYPTCNYKWTKSGSSTAVNSATLSLGSLNRTEAGTYTCTVSNPTNGEKQTKPVSIFVRYGPDIGTTTLTPASTTYTLVENTHLDDIVCEADCYPKCQYKWTKPDNSVVSNNGMLSLGALNRNEATTYTCTVTRPQTTVSVTKTVSVIVIYGPDVGSVTLDPVKGTYTENEGTRLDDITCFAACYPMCSYKWTKSGTNTVVSNTDVLTLATLNRDNAATYTCTASNSRKSRTATAEVIIYVRYGPDACNISSISPLTLTEGESSPTVSCESECYPSCSHTWSNVSSNIGEDGKFQLVKATRYQAGNYKCVCRNTAAVQYVKNQTAILHIVVQYPPDVSVLLSTEDLSEDNNLTIACVANGVPSVYNYNGLNQTWNGTPVPNTHTEVTGTPKYSTLYIPSLQLQDTGTYTCYVNNSVNTADTVSSVIVQVKVLPKILTHTLQFAGKTGGTVNVSVQFYSFPDIQEVVFQRQDNQTITNGTTKYTVSHFETTVQEKFYGKDVSLEGMQANMIISDLKEEYFGNYTLILKNELGKTMTSFAIDAESEPSAPTGFKYISQAGSISFTWYGGFNGGRLQTFIIQASIADQDNWQNITTVVEKMDTQNVVTYWANVSSLSPGTYSARLFAWNVYGQSDYVILDSPFTIRRKDNGGSSLPVAAVIGGSSAAIAVFVAIAAISFLIYKRRFKDKGGSQSRLDRGHVTAEGDSDDEDEVNTVNPMYVSADEVKPGLSAENTYAQPVKKKKQDIYAMVDKKPKKNGHKKNKEGKVKKATDGDIYENAPEKADGTECRNAFYENPYENPENSTATRRPGKNINKDGLIYADLTFNDQPRGQKKLVIHGLDSMTEYVEVDFTKKAEPLPDSDEEK